jgi:hypothetical protein
MRLCVVTLNLYKHNGAVIRSSNRSAFPRHRSSLFFAPAPWRHRSFPLMDALIEWTAREVSARPCRQALSASGAKDVLLFTAFTVKMTPKESWHRADRPLRHRVPRPAGVGGRRACCLPLRPRPTRLKGYPPPCLRSLAPKGGSFPKVAADPRHPRRLVAAADIAAGGEPRGSAQRSSAMLGPTLGLLPLSHLARPPSRHHTDTPRPSHRHTRAAAAALSAHSPPSSAAPPTPPTPCQRPSSACRCACCSTAAVPSATPTMGLPSGLWPPRLVPP